MNKKLIALIIVVVVALGAVAFKMNLNPVPPPEISPTISIQEIRKLDGPDLVLLTNGESIKDMGYDIVLLSHSRFENGQSIFLFKSYSCRACEPEIRLWIYSTVAKVAEDFDFPGRHFVINGEGKGEEVVDFEGLAIYGECENLQRGLWLTTRSRSVESDGTRPVTSEQWENVSTRKVEFQIDGSYKVTNDPSDSFAQLKQLIGEKCQQIEGEDRHDYL